MDDNGVGRSFIGVIIFVWKLEVDIVCEAAIDLAKSHMGKAGSA